MIGINLKPPAFQSHVLSTSQVSFLYIKRMAFSYLSYNTCDFDYRIKTQAIRKTFYPFQKAKKNIETNQ